MFDLKYCDRLDQRKCLHLASQSLQVHEIVNSLGCVGTQFQFVVQLRLDFIQVVTLEEVSEAATFGMVQEFKVGGQFDFKLNAISKALSRELSGAVVLVVNLVVGLLFDFILPVIVATVVASANIVLLELTFARLAFSMRPLVFTLLASFLQLIANFCFSPFEIYNPVLSVYLQAFSSPLLQLIFYLFQLLGLYRYQQSLQQLMPSPLSFVLFENSKVNSSVAYSPCHPTVLFEHQSL